eukprot:1246692-Amphidinium_carterae.1
MDAIAAAPPTFSLASERQSTKFWSYWSILSSFPKKYRVDFTGELEENVGVAASESQAMSFAVHLSQIHRLPSLLAPSQPSLKAIEVH